MKAKLMLNGKEYEIELTEKQVAEIETAQKSTTGFGFGEKTTYCVSPRFFRNKTEPYFSSEKLCEDYTRVMELFLNISEWQAQNDVPANNFSWYEISAAKNFSPEQIIAAEIGDDKKYFGTVKFSTKEKAEEAINIFRKELTWYFTEFKSRLDM